MKIKSNWLLTIFLVGVSLFFLYASYLGVLNLVRTTSYSYHYVIVILILVLIFWGGVVLLTKIKLNKRSIFLLTSVILLMGLGLRIYSYNSFKTEPVSDFANGFKLYQYEQEGGEFLYHSDKSENNFYQNYFATYPSWYTYDMINYGLTHFLGSNPLYYKIVNLILFSLSLIFLYLGIANMFNPKVGLLSILAFSLMPSLIVYTNVATPDHFTILLMTLIIFFWSLTLKSRGVKKYLLTIPLVLSMCLINLFKPIAIYMLLVYIGSEVLVHLFRGKKKLKDYIKSNWQYFLYFVILFLVIYVLINNILNMAIEKKMKITPVNSTSSYLIWGYSVDENGNYNSGYLYNKVYPELMTKYNGDLELVYKELGEIAKENFLNNRRYLPRILYTKYQIALIDEKHFFDWANTSSNQEIVQKNNVNTFRLYSNIFMIIGYLAIGLVAIKGIFDEDRQKELVIILLMIVGYVAILILGGVQPRYKALIFPQFCVIVGIFVQYIYDIWYKVKPKLTN